MAAHRENRPDIASITKGLYLCRWSWLKSELVGQAKLHGLRTTGRKTELPDRLAHFLDTGKGDWPGNERETTAPKLNWHSGDLTIETVITSSYRDTQKGWRFFKAHAGAGFKSNITFMAWMKANTGKTIGEALVEYHRQQSETAKSGRQGKIASNDQYRQ